MGSEQVKEFFWTGKLLDGTAKLEEVRLGLAGVAYQVT
jgi:hypothetical protein